MGKYLEVRNLSVHYKLKNTRLFEKDTTLKAVDDVSFSVDKGSTFSIVGESGSGKSTIAKTIVGLEKIHKGKILYNSNLIDYNDINKLNQFRRRCQIIFQDPYSSLNPKFKIGDIIFESVKFSEKFIDKTAVKVRVLRLLEEVGLHPEDYDKYPHQFSGGQRQRIAIARALGVESEILLCDEPVSALDVSIQAQILNLLKRLQRKHNLTYIFISHDLSVVKYLSDYIAVMKNGKVVEEGDKIKIFNNAEHEYTKTLLKAVPEIKK